jgi:hypothetical protein
MFSVLDPAQADEFPNCRPAIEEHITDASAIAVCRHDEGDQHRWTCF